MCNLFPEPHVNGPVVVVVVVPDSCACAPMPIAQSVTAQASRCFHILARFHSLVGREDPKTPNFWAYPQKCPPPLSVRDKKIEEKQKFWSQMVLLVLKIS